MDKFKYIIKIVTVIIIMLFLYSLSINNRSINSIKINKIYKNNIPLKQNIDTSKGYISIKKINLTGKLYDINSNENTIEKNITIRDIDEKQKYFLIMAHSGTGPKAFFKRLKELTINDEIIIKYNNILLTYYITKIEHQEKTGTINIKKEDNTLILTTCDSNNKQLIIYSKKEAHH